MGYSGPHTAYVRSGCLCKKREKCAKHAQKNATHDQSRSWKCLSKRKDCKRCYFHYNIEDIVEVDKSRFARNFGGMVITGLSQSELVGGVISNFGCVNTPYQSLIS